MDADSAVDLACDVYEPHVDSCRCPILLLHGLFWNKHMLRELAEELCHATGRKVLCPDLRCHDRSPFREECNALAMASDIWRLMETRGVDRAAFVCHSFSSTLAYLLTLEKPDAVERLVFVDHCPFPARDEKFFNLLVRPQVAVQDRFLVTLDRSLSLAEAKERLMALSRAAQEEGHKVFLRKVAYELVPATTGPSPFAWRTDHTFLLRKYSEGAFSPDPRGRCDHPILIIRCERSERVTDKMHANVLRFNSNVRLVTMKDCTHLLMFEKRDEFVGNVTEFLSAAPE